MLSGGRYQPLLAVRRARLEPDQTRWLRRACSRRRGSTPTRPRRQFFKSISIQERLAGLFDFENRRTGTGLPPFFPMWTRGSSSVPSSLAGVERRFDETECAFFLHDTETIADPDRCFPLSPSDFTRVNPNTGTAPIFRTRQGRRDHAPHLRAASGAGRPFRQRGAPRMARPVHAGTVRHDQPTPTCSARRRSLTPKASTPSRATAGSVAKSCTCLCMKARWCRQFDHRANASVRVVNPESTH